MTRMTFFGTFEATAINHECFLHTQVAILLKILHIFHFGIHELERSIKVIIDYRRTVKSHTAQQKTSCGEWIRKENSWKSTKALVQETLFKRNFVDMFRGPVRFESGENNMVIGLPVVKMKSLREPCCNLSVTQMNVRSWSGKSNEKWDPWFLWNCLQADRKKQFVWYVKVFWDKTEKCSGTKFVRGCLGVAYWERFIVCWIYALPRERYDMIVQ